MQHAVLLEVEFHNFIQGDLSITDYCNKLKKLADNHRDVGHPVSKPSQVLNLLHGLNKRFCHVKPVLSSKTHTFMSASSYLLLEELQLQQDDKTEAGQALLASHDGSSTSGGSAALGGLSSSSGSPGNDNNRGYKNKSKRRDHSLSGGSAPASGGGTPGSHP
jgi:hypothetical protein